MTESEILRHIMKPMFTELEDSEEARTHRRLTRLFDHYPARWVWAGFVFVNGFISIGILAFAAYISKTVFIFPSLGPTAFLFFYRPMEPAASPRNAICGHALGILCGYAALLLFGLSTTPAAEGFTFDRVFCAGLALASTCAFMVLFKVIHPPAASTTLIVALGVVTQPFELVVLELAVIALTIQGIVINRSEGLDYPLWAPRHHG